MISFTSEVLLKISMASENDTVVAIRFDKEKSVILSVKMCFGALAACIVNCLGGIVAYTGRGLCCLGLLGFTAIGIAAGSLAAGAMSFFGVVAAGSVIAVATSMAMRG